jgi:hypothetical protein
MTGAMDGPEIDGFSHSTVSFRIKCSVRTGNRMASDGSTQHAAGRPASVREGRPARPDAATSFLSSVIECLNTGLVKVCAEHCDASCYRCLRSFKNKFEHAVLDRHVGAELLDYLLSGSPPVFDAQRRRQSKALLHGDLLRRGYPEVVLQAGVKWNDQEVGEMELPLLATITNGDRFVVALSSR